MSIQNYSADAFRKAMNASPRPEWYTSDVSGLSMGEFSFNDAPVRNHTNTADQSEISAFTIRTSNLYRPCIFPYPYNKNASAYDYPNAYMGMTFSWDDTSDIYDIYSGYAGYFKNWFGTATRNTSRNFLWPGEISILDGVTREIGGFYGKFEGGVVGGIGIYTPDLFYLYFNSTSDPFAGAPKAQEFTDDDFNSADFWEWARFTTDRSVNRNYRENSGVKYEATFGRSGAQRTTSTGFFGSSCHYSWSFTYNVSSHVSWSGSSSKVGDEIYWAMFRCSQYNYQRNYYLFLYG